LERTSAAYDWADSIQREFLISVFYSERTSSMQPAVTGFVSDCCNARTYERLGRDGRYCIKCDGICRERSLWSPNMGMASKGGWDPSPVWRLVEGEFTWAPRDQVMYCNPTRAVRPTGQELRVAALVDRGRSLTQLVKSTPRHFTKGEWKLYRLAWEGAVHPQVNSAAEVVGMAHAREWRRRIWPTSNSQRAIARTLALWDEASVERWVEFCRWTIVRRKREHPGDYPEVGRPPDGSLHRPMLLSRRLSEREMASAA